MSRIDPASIPLGYCIFCNVPIYNHDKKFVLALEKPIRINLWTHRSCYNGQTDVNSVKEFLRLHLQDYLDKYMSEEFSGNGKAKTKKIKSKKPISEVDDANDKKRRTRKRNNSRIPTI